MNERKITLYLRLARETAEAGTCPKLRVGAVLVSDDRVISIGYNGAPRGVSHCAVNGCDMETVYVEDDRQIGLDKRAYGGAATKGAILFATHSPCKDCTKLLINAGVVQVYYAEVYHDPLAEKIAQEAGLERNLFSSKAG